MKAKNYDLTFLPLFEEDLAKIVSYISKNLHNPTAAHQLVDDVEQAIFERLQYPDGYEPFQSLKNRPHPYYTITVKNFMIFYVLIGKTMEVRRILYRKRDMDKLL
ncbi:plasmid stabilization system protein ParE [Streptococcus rupicaprae]|uniref:Plasmid stabilization system protein ParE n=1 Tax=Streptococcus rupicaprae TaxID=759619 RepID=A0ABV2FG08_9STRE